MTARVSSGDMWMTGPEVCKMIRCNMNQLYKLNQQLAFPVYKRGKHCLYLYSEVNNWLLNQSLAIKDDGITRKLPVEELPRVWPPEAWPLEPDDDPKPPKARRRKVEQEPSV